MQSRFKNKKNEEQLKSLVQQLVEKVIVYKEEIEVILKITLVTNGGGEGSRTPVRKNRCKGFSERSRCFRFAIRAPAGRLSSGQLRSFPLHPRSAGCSGLAC